MLGKVQDFYTHVTQYALKTFHRRILNYKFVDFKKIKRNFHKLNVQGNSSSNCSSSLVDS